MFKLRDLEFSVDRATITGTFQNGELSCFIDIDMRSLEIDGENWKPYLHHQGLKIPVSSWEELQGNKVEYQAPNNEIYNHPEIGILYVFGHEPTNNNIIEFGEVQGNAIEFKWTGENDVYWDDEFGSDVPFELETKLEIINA